VTCIRVAPPQSRVVGPGVEPDSGDVNPWADGRGENRCRGGATTARCSRMVSACRPEHPPHSGHGVAGEASPPVQRSRAVRGEQSDERVAAGTCCDLVEEMVDDPGTSPSPASRCSGATAMSCR